MAPVRQGSFLGGELAPQMWGRSDSPAYQSGLRLLKNAFVTRQGTLCKRPGTEFRAVADGPGKLRLVPFIYASGVSCVLVFRAGIANVLVAGSYVGIPPDPQDDRYEIAHPYTEAQLPFLKYVQSGDVLTLTHPAHAPRTLTRIADDNWSLAVVDFSRPTSRPTAGRDARIEEPIPTPDAANPRVAWDWRVAFIWQMTDGSLLEGLPMDVDRTVRKAPVPWWNSGTTYALNALVEINSGPFADKIYKSLQNGNINKSPNSSPTWWQLETDYQAPRGLPVSPDKTVTISWGKPGSHWDIGDVKPPGASFYTGFRVYRGQAGRWGLVGENVGNGNAWWTDYGAAPDYLRPPVEGRNPFVLKDPSTGATVRTEHPAVVGYHQERRLYARTDQRTETCWFSRVADYDTFATHTFLLPDDSVDVRLASRRREEVRSALALSKLLLFTDAAVWALDGGGVEGALEATSIPQARVQSEIGASWLDPLVVDGAVLYARAGNDGVQRLTFENERGGYSGGDVSVTAQHLLRGRPVISWAHARSPHGLVWVALEDGSLLSLTYLPEQDVAAWAQHDVGGKVESLCVVPENGSDSLYLSVQRDVQGTPTRYVERLRHGTADDSASRYLDAHRFQGPTAGAITALAINLKGKVAQWVQDGIPGPLATVPAGGYLTIPGDAAVTVQETVWGLPFTVDVGLLDLAGSASLRQKRVKSVAFEVRASSDVWVGEDASRLTEWRQREVSDGYGPTAPFTGLAEVRIGSAWNTTGRAVLQHRQPLHLEVLGITREVDVGG